MVFKTSLLGSSTVNQVRGERAELEKAIYRLFPIKWQTDGGAMQSIRCRTIQCIRSFRKKKHENARDLAHEATNV